MSVLKIKNNGVWEQIGGAGGVAGGGFVAQPEAPENTNLLWIDTDDVSDDDIPSAEGVEF